MISFQELGRRARLFWSIADQSTIGANFTGQVPRRVELKACKHFCDQTHRRPLCCRCMSDKTAMRKCQVCRHVMRWTRK